MIRERALKVALVMVGLLFAAASYPLLAMRLDESLQMMLGVYATLGVFLLMAARNPSANRSLIAFAAWSSVVHAGVMAVQAVGDVSERMHLVSGVVLFAVVALALIALAPARVRAAA